MEQIDEPNPRQESGLWRLSAAARYAGLNARQFTKASESGAIPVGIVTLGERSHFVRIAELKAWLAVRPAAESLFI